jgi:hypothetical protein
MLDGFEQWDPEFDINVGNLPYCILPQWASRIHHGGQQTITKSSDSEGLEDAMNKYEWQASLRTHLPGCADCVFRSRCTGIFRVYLEMHGGDEFKPLTHAALAALDPEGRNFVILVEPLLAPLRAALAAGSCPASWRLQHEVTEDRRRRVELVFAHDSGASVRFMFAAPGQDGAAVITSDAYDVTAEADLTVPPQALRELLGWLRGQLAAGRDGAAQPALADDAVERAVRRSVILRARQRVALFAGRVQSRFARPGWWLEALRWPQADVAELTVRGPEAARIDVRFTLGVRGTRSQVGVDFRIGEGAAGNGVKPVVDELALLLRGTPSGEPAAAAAAAASQ